MGIKEFVSVRPGIGIAFSNCFFMSLGILEAAKIAFEHVSFGKARGRYCTKTIGQIVCQPF